MKELKKKKIDQDQYKPFLRLCSSYNREKYSNNAWHELVNIQATNVSKRNSSNNQFSFSFRLSNLGRVASLTTTLLPFYKLHFTFLCRSVEMMYDTSAMRLNLLINTFYKCTRLHFHSWNNTALISLFIDSINNCKPDYFGSFKIIDPTTTMLTTLIIVFEINFIGREGIVLCSSYIAWMFVICIRNALFKTSRIFNWTFFFSVYCKWSVNHWHYVLWH